MIGNGYLKMSFLEFVLMKVPSLKKELGKCSQNGLI